jgi:hypothetical protein
MVFEIGRNPFFDRGGEDHVFHAASTLSLFIQCSYQVARYDGSFYASSRSPLAPPRLVQALPFPSISHQPHQHVIIISFDDPAAVRARARDRDCGGLEGFVVGAEDPAGTGRQWRGAEEGQESRHRSVFALLAPRVLSWGFLVVRTQASEGDSSVLGYGSMRMEGWGPAWGRRLGPAEEGGGQHLEFSGHCTLITEQGTCYRAFDVWRPETKAAVRLP